MSSREGGPGRGKPVANRDLSHTELYGIAEDVAGFTDLKDASPRTAAGLLAKLRQWQSTLPEKPEGAVLLGAEKRVDYFATWRKGRNFGN